MSLRFILLFLAAMLTVSAYQSYRDRSMVQIWPFIRPRHTGLALLFIAAVVLSMLAFSLVPGLDWGYIQAMTGQQGSVYNAPAPIKTQTIDRILPLWILVALVLNMPAAVMAEEKLFRANVSRWRWPRLIAMQLLFGLMHMILGIPLYAALGLAVFGLLLSGRHLQLIARGQSPQAALMDGASIHLSYNLMLALFLLIGALVILI